MTQNAAILRYDSGHNCEFRRPTGISKARYENFAFLEAPNLGKVFNYASSSRNLAATGTKTRNLSLRFPLSGAVAWDDFVIAHVIAV